MSQSRGEYAYTIIDTESDISDKLIADIAAKDNVIKVRKI